LTEELSIACPNRIAPAYPSQSRRIGEQGHVVLLVIFIITALGHPEYEKSDRRIED
jgi:outer membrane biosynthesis protein TonB